jgi:glycosyltransferase involved in cell wall biosynthesis
VYISFIIPAWNEESVLGPVIEAVKAAMQSLPEPYEIIVADDGSTDRTAEIARAGGARVVNVHHRQIAATRNAGARAARGDLFFFIDADTLVTEQVLRAAIESVRSGAIGGGCAFRFDGWLPLYARLLQPLIVRCYRFAGLASGCFLFCTRAAFDTVGGFNCELYAAEEGAMSLSLRRHGRFVVLPQFVITSGRKLRTHSLREIATLMFRIIFCGRRYLCDPGGLDIWYGARRPDPACRNRTHGQSRPNAV